MKYILNVKNAVLALSIIIVATSCKKSKTIEPMGDAGKTLVKIIGGGTPANYGKQSIDFVNTPNTIAINIMVPAPLGPYPAL